MKHMKKQVAHRSPARRANTSKRNKSNEDSRAQTRRTKSRDRSKNDRSRSPEGGILQKDLSSDLLPKKRYISSRPQQSRYKQTYYEQYRSTSHGRKSGDDSGNHSIEPKMVFLRNWNAGQHGDTSNEHVPSLQNSRNRSIGKRKLSSANDPNNTTLAMAYQNRRRVGLRPRSQITSHDTTQTSKRLDGARLSISDVKS